MSKNRKTPHRKRRDLVALQQKRYNRQDEKKVTAVPLEELVILEETDMSEETTTSVPVIPFAGPIANPLAVAETFMIAEQNEEAQRLSISIEQQLLMKKNQKDVLPTFDATLPSTMSNIKSKMQANVQTSEHFLNLVEASGNPVSEQERKRISSLNSIFRAGGKSLRVTKEVVEADIERLAKAESAMATVTKPVESATNTATTIEPKPVKKELTTSVVKPKNAYTPATATTDINSILDSMIACESSREITVEDTVETSEQHFIGGVKSVAMAKSIKTVRPAIPIIKREEKITVAPTEKREVPTEPVESKPVVTKSAESVVESFSKKAIPTPVITPKKPSAMKPLTKAQMRAQQKEMRLAKIKAAQEAKALEKAEEERRLVEEKAKKEAAERAAKMQKATEEAKEKAVQMEILQQERSQSKTALLSQLRELLAAEKGNPIFTDTHQVLAMDKGPYIIPPKAETNIDDLLFALEIFEEYLSNTKKELDTLYEAIRQCDMETTDLLHVVELDNLTTDEQNEFLDKLREVRSRRRSYKVRQTFLMELKTFLDNTENIIPKINGLSLKLATVLRRKENAIYAPRIRTDIKETDNIRYLERPFGNQKGSASDD